MIQRRRHRRPVGRGSAFVRVVGGIVAAGVAVADTLVEADGTIVDRLVGGSDVASAPKYYTTAKYCTMQLFEGAASLANLSQTTSKASSHHKRIRSFFLL